MYDYPLINIPKKKGRSPTPTKFLTPFFTLFILVYEFEKNHKRNTGKNTPRKYTFHGRGK